MKTKICTKCKEEKTASKEYFHASTKIKCGLRSVCRECRSKDHADNQEERSAKKKLFYNKNKERLTAIIRANYIKKQDDRRQKARERHHANRERELARMRQYRADHLEELNARRRPKSIQSFRDRYKVDLVFTLKHRMGSLVRRSIRNGKKSNTMEKCLGYGVNELKHHLESKFTEGMTWERFMAGEIHIDHIIPICFFNPTTTDSQEFKDCWKIENLQPLWATDNLSKAGKLPVST